ncbi:BCCT family transporter [Phytohalomonas tamaricis]|uniref:BCCT family transporter n=1 Tax=Phytohalomonas tamaricis TaxID=2081032 RepID=UPI000D0AF999|nr:BCCT family transporter [Phytohalomonas tamaricis]
MQPDTSSNAPGYRLVFALSGGFLLLFVIAALINLNMVSSWINTSFAWSTRWFGAYWQLWMLINFIIALVLACSRYGDVRLGGADSKKEMSTFKWHAVILCALLGAGGVFWSTAEPIYHFITTPPAFAGIEPSTTAAIAPALAQSFLHWGFSAWACLGTLSALVVMHAHYHAGIRMRPRAMLYPLFGKRIETHWFGVLADVVCIIAVAAGTIGPIGFLATQLSYSFHALFGFEDVYAVQLTVLAVLVVIYTLSAATGLSRGIQWLSSINVWLVLFLFAVLLIVGPGTFIAEHALDAFSIYFSNFISMSLVRSDTAWLGGWTLFFWGWFIGFVPSMAIFVARISRGRTLRELVLAVAITAPIATNIWFATLGGSGIFYELFNPGSVSGPLSSGGLPAALLAVTTQLPWSEVIVPLFLVLTIIFVSTTGDSMAYAIAMSVTGKFTPPKSIRIFWAVAFGAVAAVLLMMGEGGINALQSFIVITAVPVSVLLLPTLWLGPQVAHAMAFEQGLVSRPGKLNVTNEST